MACRDMTKCEQTREKIVADSFNNNIVCRECDLASIESIRRFADEINQNEKSLHLLINNAGVMWHPAKLTKDGFEQHLGVNYLGVSERECRQLIEIFLLAQVIFSSLTY
jgi:NAD(P)-dependent dehydrogenase (short-subunit alcohol dehydrogenase family)